MKDLSGIYMGNKVNKKCCGVDSGIRARARARLFYMKGTHFSYTSS
jgi:hypothetical protein